MTARTPNPLRTTLAALEISRWALLQAVLTGAAATSSAVALLAVSAWLITRAWQMPPVLDLSVAVVAVRALGIGRGVLRYAERLGTHHLALHGLVRLREQVYTRLATTPLAGHPVQGLRYGDVLARIGADIDRIGDVVIKSMVPMASAALVGVASVGLSACFNGWAALGLAAALLVSGVLSPWWSYRLGQASQAELVAAHAAVSAALHTHLQARQELRVAGRIHTHRQVVADAEARLAAAHQRAARPHQWADAVHLLAMLGAVAAALVAGQQAVAAGQLSAPAWGLLCLLPLAAVEVCAGLPSAALQMAASTAAAARISALLRPEDSAPPTAETVAAPVQSGVGLVADGLEVGWQHPLPDLPRDLLVQPGQMVLLTGPNGSGKSTLGLTLAGLLPALAGRITADAPVFYAAADGHIFGTTLRDNLLLACPDPCAEGVEADLWQALEQVGLADWARELPEGLDTPLASGGASMSGGQRRRLLLARALLTQARYLILDEPTEHLDADGAAGVWDLLHQLADQRRYGILAITHTPHPQRSEGNARMCHLTTLSCTFSSEE